MQTITTTMNKKLNRHPGMTDEPAIAVESANPLEGTEKQSVMARLAPISSGIFGKIKRVMPSMDSAKVAASVPDVLNIPDYKLATRAEIAPIDTMVYQPPMAISRRGLVVGIEGQRSSPDLSKDLFAHLSVKPVSSENVLTARTLTINEPTSAKLSVYPRNSAPRARVLPRPVHDYDYNYDYKDNVEKSVAINFPKDFGKQIPSYPDSTSQSMDMLEDANNYVAEQNKQSYADLYAQRSRGLVKNLSLWATRIKEDVISAVAPNYVMKKAYEAAHPPAVTPVAQPAAVYNPAPVQAKPSIFSRLKAGYENAKATLFPKARKLVTAAALAGAALGLNASEQSSSQPVGAQKTAVAYAAKTASKTEAKSLYSSRVSAPVKNATPAPAATPKAAYPAKSAPIAYSTTYSKTIPAVNARSLNSTSPDSTASSLPNIGFQNGIYRGYQPPSDGSAPVSRTSLCSR